MADCSHLTDAEHGRYIQLLILMWRSPNQRVPNDDEWLARKFRRSVEAVRQDLRPLISEFCSTDGNWITQKRLAREWSYVSKRAQQRSDAAKARWNKDKDICGRNAGSHVFRNAPTPTPTPTPTKEEKEAHTSPSAPPARLNENIQLAVDAWNEMATRCGLAQVQKLTAGRKTALSQRLKDAGGMDGWRNALAKIEASPFLLGKKSGRGWKATFDFVVKEQQFTKILEGAYDDAPTNGHDQAAAQAAARVALVRGSPDVARRILTRHDTAVMLEAGLIGPDDVARVWG